MRWTRRWRNDVWGVGWAWVLAMLFGIATAATTAVALILIATKVAVSIG